MPLQFLDDVNVVQLVSREVSMLPVCELSWHYAHRILRRHASAHKLAFSMEGQPRAITCLLTSTVMGKL